MPKKKVGILPGFELEKIISSTKESIEKLTQMFEEEKKNYGFLTIMDKDGYLLLPPTEIGNVPLEKREKYSSYSLEKAKRLQSNIKRHFTSYESRDPENGKWGGAISVNNNLIFSFSGLTEHGDEAIMLRLAKKVKVSNHFFSSLIKELTGNPYICKRFLS
jgi:hypothetical protein